MGIEHLLAGPIEMFYGAASAAAPDSANDFSRRFGLDADGERLA